MIRQETNMHEYRFVLGTCPGEGIDIEQLPQNRARRMKANVWAVAFAGAVSKWYKYR